MNSWLRYEIIGHKTFGSVSHIVIACCSLIFVLNFILITGIVYELQAQRRLDTQIDRAYNYTLSLVRHIEENRYYTGRSYDCIHYLSSVFNDVKNDADLIKYFNRDTSGTTFSEKVLTDYPKYSKLITDYRTSCLSRASLDRGKEMPSVDSDAESDLNLMEYRVWSLLDLISAYFIVRDENLPPKVKMRIDRQMNYLVCELGSPNDNSVGINKFIEIIDRNYELRMRIVRNNYEELRQFIVENCH